MPRKSENSSRKNRLWMKPWREPRLNIRPIGTTNQPGTKHAPGATPPEVPSTLTKSGLAKSFRLCGRSFERGETGRSRTGAAGARPCTQSSVRGRETARCCSMPFHRKSSTRLRRRPAARLCRSSCPISWMVKSSLTRMMQAIVLGMTGSGKTTLLRNIITQDLFRVVGPPEDQHRIPMIILDGKADMEFFYSLLPHIHRAGRLGQLRVINPSRPNLSVRYNPFHCTDDNYMPVVNMVFGSFNLHDEFFGKHQLNYLADIVRVLAYTGLKFNFYDVLVIAIDEQVLREQVTKASRRLEHDMSISTQRKLNFEMSVKNLYQSFQDRERVPKIQGLLNECMTFLDDELSIITGPYEDLLSLDEVIEQELILFVTLNVNKNTEPVRALGKMLLQNLQLEVGKRYESEEQRHRTNRPLFSVILDEFAPFGYRNFPQILQTARGTNTAFLFSMQSLPQLMHVGRGFKED